MKKYILIYTCLLKLNFTRLIVYRVNFINSLLSSIGWAMANIIAMYLLTFKITSAYGWTKQEFILLAACYPIFTGIFYMVFAKNLGHIPEIIHKGELDVALLRPVDTQFFLSTGIIDFMQVFRLIVSIVFIIIYVKIVHFNISLSSIFLSIPIFICGMLIVYSLWYMSMTISLWFSTLSNLKDLLYTFNGTMKYPYQILFKNNNFFFFFLLPFTFSLSIPLKIFLSKGNLFEAILVILLGGIFLVFSRLFWKFALRFYTSASG